MTGTSSSTQRSTDTGAVLALVLAFLLPPVGAALAIYGRGGGKLTGLRVAATVIGLALTVMAVLVGVMVFAGENASSR